MGERMTLPGLPAPPMRGLTLWRPWAAAIVHGPKRVENRPWAPPEHMLGKLIAIHAGQTYREGPMIWGTEELGYWLPARPESEHPTGIVGVARVVGYLDLRKSERRRVVSPAVPDEAGIFYLDQDPWWVGPVGWLLGDVQALPEPIPHPGSLGLWRVPPEKARAIMGQIRA